MEDSRPGPRRLLVHVGHTWMPLPVGEWVIGRAPDSDILIDDDRVSRRHAVVRALSSGWELADGGSLNGIWLDGRQVQRAPIPAAGLTVLFGGRDGVPVRLLPVRTRAATEPAGPAANGAARPGPTPAPGTLPAGVRFQEVTPEWTAPESVLGPPGGEETGVRRLRAFMRQAGRLVRREGLD
ncbi:MAG TPA: FHA domain-containing protein [Kineosporiaceae bacterium]|nr:FHA domain-containing protein [Kineosporiaceae bacterium]